MDVTFSAPELRALDGVTADAFAFAFFSGQLPCRGGLGMIDWRLAGWLSRRLADRDSPLEKGARWLIGLSGKFSVPRLLLVGMGEAGEFSEERYLHCVQAMVAVAKQSRFRRLAIELPGRSQGLITPSRAIELIFQNDSIAVLLDDMVLIDEVAAQHEIQSTIKALRAGRRRRSQAPLPD